MHIRVLKAFHGDCILISLPEDDQLIRHILIDGGPGDTFLCYKSKKGKPEDGELKMAIDAIRKEKQKIDLLIITHIDDDHLGGILRWLKEDKYAYQLIGEVWFNSGAVMARQFALPPNPSLEPVIEDTGGTATSIPQGKMFEQYISDHGIPRSGIIQQGDSMERYGLRFQFLSPETTALKRLQAQWEKEAPDRRTAAKLNDYHLSVEEHLSKDIFQEDQSLPNSSSLAFILNWKEKKFLLLGDAQPTVVAAGLNQFGYTEDQPLCCELVKISHHGSAGNSSPELLKLVCSHSYIISTNGYGHQHPDKQMLSRLIRQFPECSIWFNYKERRDMIFTHEDRLKYPGFITNEIVKEFDYSL